MVLLTTTPQVLELIASLPATTLASLKAASSDPLPSSISSPISHKTLIALSRLCSNVADTSTASLAKNSCSLNNLLRSTKVYVAPPPSKPDPSPEYVALMARLRAEADRRQYQTLVSQQTDSLMGSGGVPDAEEEQDPITPSLVINIFLSVVLTGVAVFIVSRWWSNEGMRVLLSLAAGIVVGIAEVVVYAGYIRNIKRSRVKERLKKERKVMLGKYTGATDEDVYDGTGAKIHVAREVDGAVSIEQEVIWGKGKHGGMRRRVRERWEKEQGEQPEPTGINEKKDG